MVDAEKTMVGSVLVADDVDIMRVMCQRALEREGFEVAPVSSGIEALKLFDLRQFEVAVLDIRMPGISGLELLKMVRGRGNPGEIIMMTAYADSGVAEEALNFGASAILIKPFEDIKVLVDAVKNSVARVRLRQGNSGAGEGLEQALLKAGMIEEDQAGRARAEAAAAGKTFRAAVADLGFADEDEMNWAVADFLNISSVRLTEEMLDHDLIKNFPPRLARKFRCIPLFRSGDELHLVTADPFQPGAVKAVSEALEVEAVFALGVEKEIDTLLTRFYNAPLARSLKDWAKIWPGLGPDQLASALTELMKGTDPGEVVRSTLTQVEDDSLRLDLQMTLKVKV